MGVLETVYKGHKIIWSDNGDNWYCSSMALENVSLAKLKQAIDKEYLKERKAASVPCILLNQNSGSFDEMTIIEKVDDTRYDTNRVAVLGKVGDRNVRQLMRLANLTPDSPAARSAIENWLGERALAVAASRRATAAFDAIPRMTLADIAGLVAAAGGGDE